VSKIRYDELSWPEIREAIERQPVILVPFGTVEDHGPHLPINTDNLILEAICLEVAQRSGGQALVLPTISYGLDEHHMDFPGTIRWTATSARSGRRCGRERRRSRLYPRVDRQWAWLERADRRLAARRVVLDTGIVCGAISPNAAIDPAWAEPTLSEKRRSEPGGIAHAGEFETAVMLYLRPDLVRMDRAVREMGQLRFPFFNWDHPEPSTLAWQDWWSRMSESGVCGDPTVATAEFGKAVIETIVENVVRFVSDFRAIPLRPRRDLHRST
jgi:creatinine amidohydrolase